MTKCRAIKDIDIEGRGSHGARPEAGIDPVPGFFSEFAHA